TRHLLSTCAALAGQSHTMERMTFNLVVPQHRLAQGMRGECQGECSAFLKKPRDLGAPSSASPHTPAIQVLQLICRYDQAFSQVDIRLRVSGMRMLMAIFCVESKRSCLRQTCAHMCQDRQGLPWRR